MKAKFTYVRPGGRTTDLTLSLDAELTVGELARRLLELDPQAGAHAPAVPTLSVVRPGGNRVVLDADLPVVDSSLRSGESISLAEHSTAFRSSATPEAAKLVVLEGPDAGKEFRLPSGTSYIGRDPSCDVLLSDPRVSRRHARVHVRTDVEVEDINSANGVVLGGIRINRSAVRAEDVVQLGDTRLSVIPLMSAGVVPPRDDRSGLMFNRSPVLRPSYSPQAFELPELARPESPRSFPLLAILSPLVLGAALFAMTRNPTSLVFVALSPLLAVGSWLDARLQGKRARRAASAAFLEAISELGAAVQQAQEQERAARLAESPSARECIGWATSLQPGLWSRRPGDKAFLELRLGLGAAPSRQLVAEHRATVPDSTLHEAQRRLVERATTIDAVPIAAALPEVGAIGIAGGSSADDVLRSLLVQLASLHSPSEVVVCAVASAATAPNWEWLKWLPHTSSEHSPVVGPQLASTGGAPELVAALEALLAEREHEDHPEIVPAVVVLLEPTAPVDLARLVQLAEKGPRVGIYTVWRATTLNALPAACRVAVAGEPWIVQDLTGGRQTALVPEMTEAAAAEEFARRLAPVVDAGALLVDDSDLPVSQSYLRLRESAAEDPATEVLERWRESGSLAGGHRPGGDPGLRALVGREAQGKLYLDLHAQGPHALVGGTTGAGKSELLQTWVLAMALAYSPQRVNFLFVDYKGGAAFAECVKLPHSVGVVTDLTPHLIRRTFTSLRAEIRFREQLLNEHEAKDIVDLNRKAPSVVLPRLVIVVDEFAALVQDAPENLNAVVDIAQRGRSLGLHLILATQRPAGVIKDSLRANTNLRLALRMADAADSTDILEEPLAAEFDPSIPGRAAVRSGPGRLIRFQAGYAGGRTSSAREPARVDIAELMFGPGSPWVALEDPAAQPAGADRGSTDLAQAVEWVRRANEAAGLQPPRRPWKDVLRDVIDLDDLKPRTDVAMPFGVVDVPDQQTSRTAWFRPDDEGNLVVYGTGGSGKTTLLRTLTASAAMTRDGGPVVVYAIDAAAGGLAMLSALPHVGSVIPGDDLERIQRLFRLLRGIVDDRAERFGAVNAGTVTDYRRIAGAPDEPRLLVLVDGLGPLIEQLEGSGLHREVVNLQQLASEGRQLGIHFVVTADRAGAVPIGMRPTLQNRVVLRLADENEYGYIGASADILTVASPPGRGLVDELEVQVAVLGGSADVAAQAGDMRELAESLTHARRGLRARPVPVRSLPAVVSLGDLSDQPQGLLLGMDDVLLEPFAIDPRGVLVVTGPPGSGRTTALATIAVSHHRMDEAGAAYFLGPPGSPIISTRRWAMAATTPEAMARLAAELTQKLAGEQPAPTVPLIVVEGIAELVSTPADAELVKLARAAANGHALLAVEGETTTLNSYTPLLSAMKAPRRGIVLQPDVNDADILRTSLPRSQRRDFPPGRGFFVERGKAVKVQIALPE